MTLGLMYSHRKRVARIDVQSSEGCVTKTDGIDSIFSDYSLSISSSICYSDEFETRVLSIIFVPKENGLLALRN